MPNLVMVETVDSIKVGATPLFMPAWRTLLFMPAWHTCIAGQHNLAFSLGVS